MAQAQHTISNFAPKRYLANKLGDEIEAVAPGVGFMYVPNADRELVSVIVEHEPGATVDLNAIRTVVEAHELNEDGKDDFEIREERVSDSASLAARVATLEAQVAELMGAR